MNFGVKILATTSIAILATSVALGMFGVSVLGNENLLQPVMTMFYTVIYALIAITAIINLPKILRALPI